MNQIIKDILAKVAFLELYNDSVESAEVADDLLALIRKGLGEAYDEELNRVYSEMKAEAEKELCRRITDEEILRLVECESPFEIRHKDGSFASENAAWMIVRYLKS